LVLYDEATQRTVVAKTPSIPAAPQQAFLNGLAALGIDAGQLARIAHGTTVATNTILEGKGARVGVVTTRGHRDALELGRGNRPVLYDITTQKFAPLVPRDRRLEVDERTLADGTVLRPVTPELLAPAIAALRAAQVDAVAVCFLHSYRNAANEQQAAALLRAALPGVFVTTSAEVVPEYREFERFSTTVLNALVAPVFDRYLGALEEALRGQGYRGALELMASSGGIVTTATARRLPVQLVLSGPAAGVAAAVHLGQQCGQRHLIACDMGGTSTDVCLIKDLQPAMTAEGTIAAYPNKTLQIEIHTIGAGGGSIAWLDRGGILQVGPQSAGADPGPAAYGRGGVEPTLTDANLVLGRLRAGPLDSALRLDRDLAAAAIARLAAHLPGLDTHRVAEGLVRIAVAKMVSAIKQVSIARGHDPRDFALLAYGGAGPMHAAFVAAELDMPRVLVPPSPGNCSALGLLVADARHDYVRTRVWRTLQLDAAALAAVLAELEATARAQLAADGVPPERVRLRRALGMRYVGQSFEVEVPLPDDGLPSAPALEQAFYAAHAARYGHSRVAESEIVNVRLAALGVRDKPALARPPAGGTLDAARRAARSVVFDGQAHDTPVYDRARLPVAARLAGPAIVEELGATTVIPPDWSAAVDPFGNLILERR
jgi:N-methylhydantoinase A